MIPPALRCCLGQRMVLLRPNPGRAESRYLLYALQSNRVQHEILVNEGTGSTVSNLRIPLLETLPIPWYPLPEQKTIGRILGALDDKIELNRRMNETLEGIARAIFKSWFVDFDPVRAKAEGRESGMPNATVSLFPNKFVNSKAGNIPDGWTLRKLGEVADVNWGDTAVTKASYCQEGWKAYSASGSDGLLPYYDYDHTGVVLSAIGANAGVSWLACGKWSCIKNTIRFWATDDGVSTEYLFFLTFGKERWPVRGSAQPFIAQGDARTIEVLVPGNNLALIFGSSIKPLIERANLNDEENNTLSTLRDTLLPRLISGQLRIKDAEKLVEKAL